MEAFWTILVGSLVAINCSLIGSYLILRKMAMMGDAISHAVLPGIVITFLLTGSRAPCVVLIGAGSIGIVATFLIEFFHRKGRLPSDAAMGITFTWLFALGVILISLFANKVDLDQDCVLHGEIAYVSLDLWISDSGINLGPRPIYALSVVLIANLAFILFGYRALYLTTFDTAFAATIGVNTTRWHYLLMGATSLTTVASFESVGAILVVALLVAPPATAYLLTYYLHHMLIVASLLGVIIAAGGYLLAAWLNGSVAGAMATVAGIVFFTAFLGTLHRQREK